jgi:hypothetical protein
MIRLIGGTCDSCAPHHIKDHFVRLKLQTSISSRFRTPGNAEKGKKIAGKTLISEKQSGLDLHFLSNTNYSVKNPERI